MIVGLCGYKQSGKSTVGAYMEQWYGFKQMAFADKLKEGIAALFDIDKSYIDFLKERNGKVRVTYDDSKMIIYEWREILQRFGTEVGREIFGQDFWISLLDKECKSDERIVITDCRFDNEVEYVKNKFGEVLYIHRPGLEGDGHASEVLPSGYQSFYTIFNDGSLTDLYYQIDRFLELKDYCKLIESSHESE